MPDAVRIEKTNDSGLNGKPQLAWDPSGNRVAYGGNATLAVMQWNGGNPSAFKAAKTNAATLAIAMSDDRLASLDQKGTVTIRDCQTLQLLEQLDSEASSAGAIRWAPDGLRFACGVNGRLRMWDWPTVSLSREVADLGGYSSTFCFSPDGKSVCIAKHARLFKKHLSSGVTKEFRRGRRTAHDDCIWSVVWTDDGKHLISHGDTHVRVWDADSCVLEREIGSTQASWQASSMDVSADGRVIGVCGMDRVVRLSNAHEGAPLLNYLTLDGGKWMVVMPNGDWIGSEDADAEIRYLIEAEDGISSLTTDQMEQTFNWRPDKQRVREFLRDSLPKASMRK
ncbi:MAG: WD40 repeat domain-containing protein [Pirellulaceae bacterium]